MWGDAADVLKGRAATQKELDELTEDFIKFSQDTCPALCLGQTDTQQETGWDCLAGEQLCAAGTEVLGHTWLNLSHQDPGRDEG